MLGTNWKAMGTGEPCADSCGIWLIGLNAVIELAVAADRVHADSEEGILYRKDWGNLGDHFSLDLLS